MMNGATPASTPSIQAPPSPMSPLEWRFSQVFGERGAGEEVQDVDIISAIEFNKSGHHLATGDRGGRVVLFERTDAKDHACRKEVEKADYSNSRHPEFRYKTEFQSHEPEFDYLKSLEIEEKINKIKWCQAANGASFLLSTNDKTIKFWKVQEKKVKKVSEMNLAPSYVPANGSPAGSTVCGSIAYLPNGGIVKSGALALLRMPVVVVLNSKFHLCTTRKNILNLSICRTVIVLIPGIPVELSMIFNFLLSYLSLCVLILCLFP